MSNENQICKTCKPKVHLVGENANVFNLMGLCTKELKKAGFPDHARKLHLEVFSSGSYSEALSIMSKYLDVQ
jgi:hypothetical protein